MSVHSAVCGLLVTIFVWETVMVEGSSYDGRVLSFGTAGGYSAEDSPAGGSHISYKARSNDYKRQAVPPSVAKLINLPMEVREAGQPDMESNTTPAINEGGDKNVGRSTLGVGLGVGIGLFVVCLAVILILLRRRNFFANVRWCC